MTNEPKLTYAERLAGDMVDNLLKQASTRSKNTGESADEVTLDPETQKRLVDREIKMAADPDFAITELAKENAVQRLRQNLNGGKAPKEPAKEKEADKSSLNQKIGENAKQMLDMGIPANVVSQYITAASAGTVAFPAMGQQGLGLQDVVTIMNMLKENTKGTDPVLTAILQKMNDRLDRLEANPNPVAPKSVIMIKPDGSTQEIEFGKPIVIEKQVPVENSTGESLDSLKEKNRHAEALANINIEKTHKQAMGESLAAIAEGFPAVLGAISGDSHVPRTAQTAVAKTNVPATAYWKCTTPDCGTMIPVTPGTTHLVCTKCGATYDAIPEKEN